MYESTKVLVRNLQELPSIFEKDHVQDLIWHLQIMRQNSDFAWYNVATIAMDPWLREKNVKTVRPFPYWGENEKKVSDHELSIIVPYLDVEQSKMHFCVEEVYSVCDLGMDAVMDQDERSPIQNAIQASGFSEVVSHLKEGWAGNLIDSWMMKNLYYQNVSPEEKSFLRTCFLLVYGKTLGIDHSVHKSDLILKKERIDAIGLYKALHHLICDFPGMFAVWVAQMRKDHKEKSSKHRSNLGRATMQAIRGGLS